MITKEILEQKYLKENKSLRMIAKELNCSKKKISYWMKHHSVQKRDLKQARNNRSARGKEFRNIVDTEKLIQYYNEGNSMQQCSKHFNIGYTAVQDRLKTYNISRKPWEHRVGAKHSICTKSKMSKTASQQIVDGIRVSHCQGNSYYCMSPNQGRIKVRSSWERDYADYLYSNNINFYYESKTFELSAGKSYVPDFYLPNTNEYVEIKGYLDISQKNKYDLFTKEYPNIKWKMLQKEDLTNILRVKPKKEVIILCGPQGAGKTWVGNKLKDQYMVIDYDIDKKYVDTIRLSPDDKPVLLQLPFKVSTFIKKYSHEFDISAISITGDPLRIKQNLLSRGGKITKTFYSRWKRMQTLTKKYCDFTGDSDQIYTYLKIKYV